MDMKRSKMEMVREKVKWGDGYVEVKKGKDKGKKRRDERKCKR